MTAFLLTLAGAGLACGLEVLEAAAIVLAVGAERSHREALIGAVGAIVALVAALLILGPLVLARFPDDVLHVVIGIALLWFGGQWLRKGVLRLAGRKAPSSAQKEFLEARAEARGLPPAPAHGADWPARILAGKGVLLEGIEVVLIVSALGADRLLPAAIGAGVAAVVVSGAAVVLHRPLTRLPESHLKYGVGVVLCSFGVFFLGEGLGVHWPLGDGFLLVLVAAILLLSQVRIAMLVRAEPAT